MPGPDPLIQLFAQSNDDELWGLIYDACYEVYGFERLVSNNPEIVASKAVSLFDVVFTVEAILNGGISRFFTGTDDQQRIIDAFREIGDRLGAQMLASALRRYEERKRESCEDPEVFREDDELSRSNSAFIRRHKDIQDAFAKYVRTNFLEPSFLGPEVVSHLLEKKGK